MKTRSLAKITIAMLALVMSVNGNAVDNSIYIDQAGSNAVINITQDGTGNTVKGIVNGAPGVKGQDAATLNGDNTQISVNQVGAGNTLSLGVKATVDSGKSANINYSVSGGNINTAIIDVNASGQGTASNIQIDVTQTGGGASYKADVQGSGNTISVTTAGQGDDVQTKIRDNSTTVNVSLATGGQNVVVTDQAGGTNSIGINADGIANSFDIKQNGAGNTTTIAGYASGDALVGNDNTIKVVQNGSNNTANIGLTGSSNWIGVNQGAGGGSTNESNIKISGNSNIVNISQGAGVPLLTSPQSLPTVRQ
jgi:hypothetical protein